jgi:hypothetical protein
VAAGGQFGKSAATVNAGRAAAVAGYGGEETKHGGKRKQKGFHDELNASDNGKMSCAVYQWADRWKIASLLVTSIARARTHRQC